MRRKQGDFFIFGGAVHFLMMVFASLYASGVFPGLFIAPYRWSHLYFSYFIYLYVGSVLLIFGQYRRTQVFLPQAILDFIVGVGVFQGLFWALRALLVRWGAVPWLALLPGVFLVYYGLKLRRGRALWKRLELE